MMNSLEFFVHVGAVLWEKRVGRCYGRVDPTHGCRLTGSVRTRIIGRRRRKLAAFPVTLTVAATIVVAVVVVATIAATIVHYTSIS